MTWKNFEYKSVRLFYWAFICLSAVMMAEWVIRWWLGIRGLDSIEVALFMHLIPCLYLPVIGLWCLHKNYNAGYIVLGIMLIYLMSQIRYVLIYDKTYMDGWKVLKYNAFLLGNLF